MKKVGYIINPISGVKSKKNIPLLIQSVLDKNKFKVRALFTERRNHGYELAKQFINEGYEYVVAAGGDGTVNEVASALVHTNVTLGIIPLGSGNGLARHLGIPMDTIQAIQLINDAEIITMDYAKLNGHPFFCTSGVGFDAYIGQEFAKQETRGFQTYIKSTLKGFISYRPQQYKITSSNGTIETDAFLITIGNISQYGNNAFICPFADVQDGLLDVTIIKPFPKLYAFELARKLFSKSMDMSRYSTLFQTVSIIVEREKEGPVHLDGEPMNMGTKLEFAIIPKSLNVLSCMNK